MEQQARYLLGLEPLHDTQRFLAQHSSGQWDPQDLANRHAAAGAHRLARPLTPAAVSPPPASWAPHIERLRERPLFQQLFDRPHIRVAAVELAHLIPVQPHVNFSYAHARAAQALSPADTLALCLSADPEPMDLSGGITEERTDLAFTVTTPDLNLAVTEAHMDTSRGVAVSFRISRTSVFCQVIQVGDHLLLKDGTHRAAGLLAAGATTLPCLLTEDGEPWDLPEHLDPSLLLGPHPPELQDFLDPALYVAHDWPARRKVIRIRVDQFVLSEEPAGAPAG